MPSTSVPRTDSALFSWSANFAARISQSRETYFLSQQQLDDYLAAQSVYADALAAALSPATRTMSAVSLKNETAAKLRAISSSYCTMIKANLQIDDQAKIDLGIVLDAARSASPVPSDAPNIAISSMIGHTISGSLLASTEASVRCKRPARAFGAMLWSFAGENLPETADGWSLVGLITRPTFSITFPSDLAPGTKVWLRAEWVSTLGKPGPSSAPQFGHIQFGNPMTANAQVRLAA